MTKFEDKTIKEHLEMLLYCIHEIANDPKLMEGKSIHYVRAATVCIVAIAHKLGMEPGTPIVNASKRGRRKTKT